MDDVDDAFLFCCYYYFDSMGSHYMLIKFSENHRLLFLIEHHHICYLLSYSLDLLTQRYDETQSRAAQHRFDYIEYGNMQEQEHAYFMAYLGGKRSYILYTPAHSWNFLIYIYTG